MKPSFRENDACLFGPLGMKLIISERLKNALEEADLVGVEFYDCPIDFQYADEV